MLYPRSARSLLRAAIPVQRELYRELVKAAQFAFAEIDRAEKLAAELWVLPVQMPVFYSNDVSSRRLIGDCAPVLLIGKIISSANKVISF
jgi:hypothetical protein